MAADESAGSPTVYRCLVDRCLDLETSQAKLKQELSQLLEEDKNKNKKRTITHGGDDSGSSDNGDLITDITSYIGVPKSFPAHVCFPGYFLDGSPHRGVLESLGHALHVCTASSGQIFYWNRAAEILYGWKVDEVIGERIDGLLVSRKNHASFRRILGNLSYGRSWSGQFPLKKKTGEVFMALVTMTSMYEGNQLVGIVTVSSDAAVYNKTKLGNMNRVSDKEGPNGSKIQWQQRPAIASSVSNLASRFLPKKRGDEGLDARVGSKADEQIEATFEYFKPGIHDSLDTRGGSTNHGNEKNDTNRRNPPKILMQAAKMFGNLKIGRFNVNGNNDEENNQPYCQSECLINNWASENTNHPRGPKASVYGHYTMSPDFETKSHAVQNGNSSVPFNNDFDIFVRKYPYLPQEICVSTYMEEKNQFNLLKELEPVQEASENQGDEADRSTNGKQSVLVSNGSRGSSSSKGSNELSSKVDCGIRWEDLQLAEEIGQGAFAVVYRGVWNGSVRMLAMLPRMLLFFCIPTLTSDPHVCIHVRQDVAVKVYFANDYKEDTLQDYKKEIDMMKTLRHPNVLLFMGAVYSPERMAMVTELLPRGSLFKTLHKNKQTLDIKRRLKMALDVTRGMNYLHRRNPPIVHRDLKSSNLLVDKNWNVKVGDFGLSKWKHATFLTARSGTGTPQWMAPEVLRNDPSDEKSDVYSFGVILWELVTVSVPWNKLNSMQVVGVVGFMDRRLELPEGLDPNISSIICDCWKSDPKQRPSFEDLIHQMTSVIQGVVTAPAQRAVE
ncbi:Serine/threonine-protein kinase EDR1 [Linum perenne]